MELDADSVPAHAQSNEHCCSGADEWIEHGPSSRTSATNTLLNQRGRERREVGARGVWARDDAPDVLLAGECFSIEPIPWLFREDEDVLVSQPRSVVCCGLRKGPRPAPNDVASQGPSGPLHAQRHPPGDSDQRLPWQTKPRAVNGG